MRNDNEATYGGNEERVLIFLPESLDAPSIPPVLAQIGAAATMCAAPAELCAEIRKGAGALLIQEEALSPAVMDCLQNTLTSQPSWSELPIIILLRHGPETQAARDALLLPGDVTLVERPVRVTALVAVVRSALRSRRRQYLVRDQMRALEQSENRYRNLFDSIDEGFCIIEVIFDENDKPIDYRFLETNPSFQKQSGMADAQGRTIRELAPNVEQHWFEIFGGIALTGKSVRYQNRAEPLHRWFDGYAFRFGQAEDRQVAVLFNDITERKQTEDELARLNTDLVARSAQLEAANQELEAFNYSASHDLRTPLSVISGYIPLIQQLCGEDLDEKCKGFLKEIAKGAERMGRLIDALLNFSRVNRAPMQRETVNLSNMAKEVIGELMQVAPERRITFQISEGVEVNGDPNLLLIVLKNLLGNAWKYTAKQEEAVIQFGVMPVAGETAFFVKDNGIGFDMAEADKLFTPFQRLTGTSEFAGHGIGLATVERIIRRHGGRVWAEGEVGKGATFYFTCEGSTNG